eukprot:5839347-Prymnesium_polylepis.1
MRCGPHGDDGFAAVDGKRGWRRGALWRGTAWRGVAWRGAVCVGAAQSVGAVRGWSGAVLARDNGFGFGRKVGVVWAAAHCVVQQGELVGGVLEGSAAHVLA